MARLRRPVREMHTRLCKKIGEETVQCKKIGEETVHVEKRVKSPNFFFPCHASLLSFQKKTPNSTYNQHGCV